MKLVIFTPVIKISAIGRMASLVTRALVSQGHDVVVVRTESPDFYGMDAYDFNVDHINWNDTANVFKHIGEADMLVYQTGDNYGFHQGCLEWLPEFPGIVCLHDYFLGHLFNDWSQHNRHRADAILRGWYGDEVAVRFFDEQNGDDFIKRMHDVSPMTEWICSMASGIITHSSWGIDRLLNSCPGPVYTVPLAYDAPDCIAKKSPSLFNSPHFIVLTIGHINPNKRVASVIRAIGNSPMLQKQIVYRLVGKIQAEAMHELKLLAATFNVNLDICEEVDDETLAQAIFHSDVLCCLRWPSFESASASAVEGMLSGRPIIVTDTGFYRELPDDCVVKINPEDELCSLQSALELLCEDSVFRDAVAVNGQLWARRTCTAEHYAKKLVECALLSKKAHPVIAAAEYFAGVMRAWGATDVLVTMENTVNPLRIFDCT